LKLPTIAMLAATAALVAGSASDSDAASRRGRNAYAAAAPQAYASSMERNGARASALRECCKATAGLTEQVWGIQGTEEYRACMASRRQME
jgi:hypothetical protein